MILRVTKNHNVELHIHCIIPGYNFPGPDTPGNQVIGVAMFTENLHIATLLPRQFPQDESGGAFRTTEYDCALM